MNAERVNLQCRGGNVSGVISNVDRRQCVEYSSKYTTGVYWGIVGSGFRNGPLYRGQSEEIATVQLY